MTFDKSFLYQRSNSSNLWPIYGQSLITTHSDCNAMATSTHSSIVLQMWVIIFGSLMYLFSSQHWDKN